MAGIPHPEIKRPGAPATMLLGRQPGMPSASNPQEQLLLLELEEKKRANKRAQQQRRMIREEAEATKLRTMEIRRHASQTELKEAVLDEEQDLVRVQCFRLSSAVRVSALCVPASVCI